MSIWGFARSRFGRWMLAALGAVGLVWAGVVAFAPQIIVLSGEGFPSATWPAPGAFHAVAGQDQAPVPSNLAPVPQASQIRLVEAEGKALLMDRADQPIKAGFAPGIDPETRFNSYSLVKSLVGVLVLRAIADGHISGLDVNLQELLGKDAPNVTLVGALTMTSGLALYGEPPKEDVAKPLDDRQFSPFSPVARLHAYGVENLFDRIEVHPDLHGQFHYQSVNTALLGLVVERAYDAPLQDVLSRLIWSPAGAQEAYWRQNPTTGRVSAYCCLYARPYDWLLVGRYLLNNGDEDGVFLPDDLWRRWVLPAVSEKDRAKGVYGWHIRHDVLDRQGETLEGPFAYMMGHGGQMVYFLPEVDMVVVRFGDRPQLLHSTLYELAK